MKKIYCLALLAVGLLVGCTDAVQNDVQTPSVEVDAVETPSYVIPIDDALDNLQSMLVELNPIRAERGLKKMLISDITECLVANRAACTTAQNLRRIPSVDSSISQDTLLYIVNFPDSSGYAILSADNRLPIDIFVVADEGNLSLEDFMQPAPTQNAADIEDGIDNGIIGGADPSFIRDLILRPVDPFVPDTPITNLGGPYTVYYAWTDAQVIAPLVRVKWGQGNPFNLSCPVCSQCGNHKVAGCVAIAVAQLLSVHQTVSTFDGVFIDWDAITATKIPAAEYHASVAHMIYRIGLGCRMNYDYGSCPNHSSSAYSSKAEIYLDSLGYQASYKTGYNSSTIHNMLLAEKPVYVAATDISVNKGHAWVVDGYLKQQRRVEYYGESSMLESVTIESREFVHCNFGWSGQCDGYYATGVFDLSSGPFRRDDLDLGTGSTRNRYYNTSYKYITY